MTAREPRPEALSAPAARSFSLRCEGAVAYLSLARPQQANALDAAFWEELPQLLGWIAAQPELRVVVLGGEGRHFCAGIDLALLEDFIARRAADAEPEARAIASYIRRLQVSITAIEDCPLPVIAAVQGACVGGGVDLIAACDIRHCSAEARFCIKEVDFGIVADVGTTQRLRHVIGYSAVAELSFTAETFDARRAQQLGLVSAVHESPDALRTAVAALADKLGAKPKTALAGVKHSLLYSRDHSVAEGLHHVADWNARHGFGADTRAAVEAMTRGRPAK